MLDLSACWEPTPKQELFLRCPVYEVLFGGAKGPGKSDALLVCHVEQHQEVHERFERTNQRNRGRCLILRKEFGRLSDLINRADHLFPVLSGGKMHWKDLTHTWTCECGYRVWFGHMEGPADHQQYHGQEYSMLCVDQCEEIPWSQYAYLKLGVRSSDPMLRRTMGVRLTSNPMGRYSDWVKKRFKLRGVAKGFDVISETVTLESGEEVTKDRVFIPATLRDNPHLGSDYEAELRAAPEHLRRAFLDGDWDVTPGSFFGDIFDPHIHVIDDLGPKPDILIPSNWPLGLSGDWGARSPASCHLYTVDNDGLIIVLDEVYGPGEDPVRWAKKIYRMLEPWGLLDKTRIPYFAKCQGVIDPACFKTDTSGGPTIAEKLFEEGLSFFAGDNDRKTGWTEIRRRLQERGGISGKIPGLRITRRCVDLIRTLPNLTAPQSEAGGDMDDIDTKQEDHAADDLRYYCMSRPMARIEKDVREDEMARWERIMLSRQIEQSARNPTTGY